LVVDAGSPVRLLKLVGAPRLGALARVVLFASAAAASLALYAWIYGASDCRCG
jgi:hypothetical protein